MLSLFLVQSHDCNKNAGNPYCLAEVSDCKRFQHVENGVCFFLFFKEKRHNFNKVLYFTLLDLTLLALEHSISWLSCSVSHKMSEMGFNLFGWLVGFVFLQISLMPSLLMPEALHLH